MFDDTTQRPCPHCGRFINWAATRCGYCWLTVRPLTRDEAALTAAPYSNHGEALRLVRERDIASIEALLEERDRLREETMEPKTALATITGQRVAGCELTGADSNHDEGLLLRDVDSARYAPRGNYPA